MTNRELALASLVLLPLGLGMVGGAVAGTTHTEIPQIGFKVTGSNQDHGGANNFQHGSQNEGNVEVRDGAQGEGNAEANDDGHDEDNAESNDDGQDKGGSGPDHENKGEENGEN